MFFRVAFGRGEEEAVVSASVWHRRWIFVSSHFKMGGYDGFHFVGEYFCLEGVGEDTGTKLSACPVRNMSHKIVFPEMRSEPWTSEWLTDALINAVS